MKRLKFHRLWSLVLVAMASAANANVAIEPGHSAMWFNPERSGEGWVLEVLDAERALIYWYTYDDAGNQRWIQGVGDLDGPAEGQAAWIIFDELYETRGPSFGPDFNPGELEILPVGSAQLSFTNCDQGEFAYDAFDTTASIDITRLSQTMGSTCRPLHGVPGEATQSYAGESGSWFDPDLSGQGFALQWLTRDEALITWYTYDSSGAPYWMVGNGVRQDDRIVFESLNATRGGRFGEAFDPNEVELIDWGRLELALGCNEGEASYESLLPEFGSGQMNLIRLTAIAGLPCEWTKPTVVDLYEVSIRRVPISADGPSLGSLVFGIGDDGSVLIADPSDNALWLSTEVDEPPIRLEYPRQLSSSVLSSDGDTVFALDFQAPTTDSIILSWTESAEWLAEPSTGIDSAFYELISHSGTAMFLLGRDSNAAQVEWIWTAPDQVRRFERPDLTGLPGPVFEPRAISDDGSRLLAGAFILGAPPVIPLPGRPLLIEGDEVRSFIDQEGRQIWGFEFDCDASCRTVAGVSDGVDGTPVDFWVQPDGGTHQYLGILQPDLASGGQLAALSGDGSILAGSYVSQFGNSAGRREPFIWSQDLGVVEIRSLEDEVGQDLSFALDFQVQDVSTDGLKILLRFDQAQLGPLPFLTTALILELTPRSGL